MNKNIMISFLVITGLLLAGLVYAANYMNYANPETMRKFQRETLSLREELMSKEYELQYEYNKEVPDTNHIAALQKEITELEKKIQATADKYGIPGSRGMMGYGMKGYGWGRHMGWCW
jgi:peptidoglycan hydrolase CwlO-like protein